jgi:hypothetical protein
MVRVVPGGRIARELGTWPLKVPASSNTPLIVGTDVPSGKTGFELGETGTAVQVACFQTCPSGSFRTPEIVE